MQKLPLKNKLKLRFLGCFWLGNGFLWLRNFIIKKVHYEYTMSTL